ncbi:pyridine nucleotide-disulfide oxidoreductase [Terrabacter sp. Soil811]|uniref:dihydrolipoyl dehydrogenase family protein n=1 Tax=Terrabacter sp. Soil811 TaxID=1736419 RepID=UPI000701855C|nr:NAD(P)/FAD-dependent oxidoreductase [Terrabacter sp. Soil811]KRF42131.1 pyridine nucleotide-disulfide oxidoreductase [Terrabacter sp. Soil811]
METLTYDLVVLGAGAVGENVADRAVQGGLSVALVERELVGGECSYWACMPSKVLVRPAQVLHAARQVPGAAQAVVGAVDVEAVLAHRDYFTSNWDDRGQVRWVARAGIDLVRGHGRFTGYKQVTVTKKDGLVLINARHAVAVATGSDPDLPDIEGLADADPWTSRDATSVKDVPTSLAIVGGGVVAAEMATVFASLGCQVHVIARHGLLESMEPFAGERVTTSLRAMGVEVLLETATTGIHRTDCGVEVETTAGLIVADEVLIATGRTPRTTDIGIETIGGIPGHWLPTDDTLRVRGYDWLYAVGDVNHRALLTHQGKYQARAAGDVIAARAAGKRLLDEPWGQHVATADHASVPQVTFTIPEVASVGLTSHQASEAGFRARVVDYDLGGVAGAGVHANGYVGKARMVVDEDRQVVLGVTFVGQDVSDLIQAATVAVVAQVPLERLWHAVPAYPTLSEVWLRLLETYGRP